MLYIVGPQKQEISDLISKMKIRKELKFFNYEIFEGKINNRDVILSCGGIGKVAIAIIVSYVLSHYNISRVINVGTCGGLSDAKPYEVILGDKCLYLDADVTPFGYEYGQMAACPKYFQCDKDGMEVLKDKVDMIGDMLSSDSFFTKDNVLNCKLSEFKDYDLKTIDMETTSVAQVCNLYETKFNILRIVSDNINMEDQKVSYEEVLKFSSQRISEILFDAINNL